MEHCRQSSTGFFYSESPRELKGNSHSLISWRGQLSEENWDWIFVNMVPLLCDKARIAKQQKVETWLNLYQLVEKLGLQKKQVQEPIAPVKYVI
jgi:hypothetical protein